MRQEREGERMATRGRVRTASASKVSVRRASKQQRGRQQGHNTGKNAWKSNLKILDEQAGPGQKGQHPDPEQPFGSTPGEVRGHPGGKKGQAMGGQRGTKKSRRAKPRRA
jgi:hypothetical protein